MPNFFLPRHPLPSRSHCLVFFGIFGRLFEKISKRRCNEKDFTSLIWDLVVENPSICNSLHVCSNDGLDFYSIYRSTKSSAVQKKAVHTAVVAIPIFFRIRNAENKKLKYVSNIFQSTWMHIKNRQVSSMPLWRKMDHLWFVPLGLWPRRPSLQPFDRKGDRYLPNEAFSRQGTSCPTGMWWTARQGCNLFRTLFQKTQMHPKVATLLVSWSCNNNHQSHLWNSDNNCLVNVPFHLLPFQSDQCLARGTKVTRHDTSCMPLLTTTRSAMCVDDAITGEMPCWISRPRGFFEGPRHFFVLPSWRHSLKVNKQTSVIFGCLGCQNSLGRGWLFVQSSSHKFLTYQTQRKRSLQENHLVSFNLHILRPRPHTFLPPSCHGVKKSGTCWQHGNPTLQQWHITHLSAWWRTSI